MTDFHGFIANCFVGGEEKTKTINGWIRNKLTFTVGGFQIEFFQREEIALGRIDKFKDHFVHTTDVIIRDIESKHIDRIDKTLKNLCWLLSFAGLSRVIYYGYEYPDSSGLGKKFSVSGTASFFTTFPIQTTCFTIAAKIPIIFPACSI